MGIKSIFKKIHMIIKNDGYLMLPRRFWLSLKNRIIKLFYFVNYRFYNAWFGISPFLFGLKHCKIGKNFYAERFFRFEIITAHSAKLFKPICEIGNNVRISDFTHIGCCNKLIIGNNVLIGSNVLITDHSHGIYSGKDIHSNPNEEPNNRALQLGEVYIGDNVFIGDGVIILPNVQIGMGVIIAANSVVASGSIIPKYTLAAGSPAKVIKQFNFIENKWLSIKNFER